MSSDVRFTKGPWRSNASSFEIDEGYIKIRGTVLGGRFKIANVLTPVYEGVSSLEAVETRANAHLIASSPDLYEVLNMLIEANENEAWRYPTVWEPLIKSAKLILAEARGEHDSN
ncbi:hypothetical protein M316_0070 [Nitrincola phage 1M3-16]|uniref:hypothetical protein n=1 Tax=Nitrincola phage 1M3-16 TaxID=1472912 RepID=UPI000444AD50|nr:hypothetical protein GJ22_gp082 [Nitrincola phage 1M3-16]AHX01135.1 hypothetical protein M316_0070 [Nitrincola phage 1M3-16]